MGTKISAVTPVYTSGSITGTENLILSTGSSPGDNAIISTSQFKSYVGGSGAIQTVKIHLTAAQIKTGNSVPILAITPSSGSKFVQVLAANTNYTFNSAAFSTSSIQLLSGLILGNPIFFDSTTIDTGSSYYTYWESYTGEGIGSISNNIYIQFTGDSATGDGSMNIYITYIEATI